MTEVTTIGLDLAKNVFQVHGVDASGRTVVRRQLRRSQVLPFFKKQPTCLVGMEACATAHHWAREIAKFGHDARLMPARYVKPYVKRNKNDAADAEAICEAVTRPTMRFVEIKSPEQQSVLMLHRTLQLFVRQRTTLINAFRAHLAEFGIVAGVGRNGVGAPDASFDSALEFRDHPNSPSPNHPAAGLVSNVNCDTAIRRVQNERPRLGVVGARPFGRTGNSPQERPLWERERPRMPESVASPELGCTFSRQSSADDITRELWEIDENLIRRN